MKLIKKTKIVPSITKETNDLKTLVTSIYDISIQSIAGIPIYLSDFKGKYLLFVNVASRCGFTRQYEDLQKLSNRYKDDLVIIGSPCNQFGNQEPGDASQIEAFCKKNYNVSFILTEKINVIGTKKHLLYSWLTQKFLNGKKSSNIKWNFHKYLVDRNGNLVDNYLSMINPLSSKILKNIS